MRKKPDPQIAEAFGRAFAEGIPWADVLRESGVSRPTWARIKAGANCHLDTLNRLRAAVDTLIERAQNSEADEIDRHSRGGADGA